MEDIVIVESNDYAQVVFDDVLECYHENTDLECHFTVNELLKTDSSDFIGIYKVGFAGLKDYLTTQQVSVEGLDESHKGKVVFGGDRIPKDDGEFYQFVYVSLGKHIRGASIPFQFKRTHINDYVAIDDNEQVIIKSKESEMNDAMNEMRTRCHNLTQANEKYERLINENEDIIKLLSEEVKLVKARCNNLNMEKVQLNQQLNGNIDNLKLLKETMAGLADENKKIKTKYDSLVIENHDMDDLLKKRISQVELLKTEYEAIKAAKIEIEASLSVKDQEIRELHKQKEQFIRLSEEFKKMNVNKEKLCELESQVDEGRNEMVKMRNDLKCSEEMVAEQEQTIHVILSERDSLNAIIQKLQKEKHDLEAQHETMSQELLRKDDKLKQVEECKEVLRNQLVVMNNEIEKANERLKENSHELYKLSDCEKRYLEENRRLNEEMEAFENEYETKLEQIRGSNYALNLAHQHLENRIKTLSSKHDKELENERAKNDKLREENENLKQRIYAGAYEYTILHKKYLKLKNYASNKLQSSKNDMFVNSQQSDIKLNEFEDLFGERSEVSITTSTHNPTAHYDNSSNRKGLYLPLNTTAPSINFNQPTSSTNSATGYSNEMNKAIQELEKILEKESNKDEQSRNLTASVDVNISTNQSSSACEICGHVFPRDADACDYSEHLASHYGPSCPICFLTFRKGYPQDEFETHVNGHFTN